MLLSQRTAATALHTTVDMLDPQPPLGERERQEAQILQQPTPSREWVGGGLSDAQIMDTAAVGVAQKEDDEKRIDEQDIFDSVVLFLAAITRGLLRRVLGADDAPFGPVMGKSRYAESALEGWRRVTEKMRKSFQEL